MSAASGDSALGIVLVYPELLGLYGDRGNALTLIHRARARGIDAELHAVSAEETIPEHGDVYLIGGGEDAPMLLAGNLLAKNDHLATAVTSGRPCLAVCAGFQLLSRTYTGPDGCTHDGLGLIDATCGRLGGARAVGEVVLEPTISAWETVTGFENHQGDARLGTGVLPLGRVVAGVGNGYDDTEGALSGSIVATYLPGPVLARNPAIADHLLAAATGDTLAPLAEIEVTRLRDERLAAASSSHARRHRS